MKAFLDTHAAVLLWEGRELGKAATTLLERSALFVSPVLRLELAFLREIDRLVVAPDQILGGLAAELGVTQSNDPLEAIVAHAMDLEWTRDPFDRLLVATASLHRASFVTRDQNIQLHYDNAIW